MSLHMIMLLMFKEQSSKNKGNANYGGASFAATLAPSLPFPKWKEGYFVKNATEEFKIVKIKSADGAMHNEDCMVTLVNSSEETRELKGRSLRGGYTFVSYGDETPPNETLTGGIFSDAPVRDDCTKLYLNIAGIREFYPRKSGEGTRILLLDKTAYIVADTAAEVAAAIIRAGGYIGSGIIGDVNNNSGSDEAQG
jgi:hypothetical protein